MGKTKYQNLLLEGAEVKPLDIVVDDYSGAQTYATPSNSSKSNTASEMLIAASNHIANRAASRDLDEGERSMSRCVEAFNVLEGESLTETQGWRFMAILKYARATAGKFNIDDYEDMAAYSALAGESEIERGES